MTPPLWQPSQILIEHSYMYQFMHAVNQTNYDQLYQWSINQPEQFWEALSLFCEIIYSHPPTKIMQPATEIWKTQWFLDAKLNFAENLLWRRDNHVALIYANEKGEREEITYQSLFHHVKNLSSHLTKYNVKSGDRVAGFVTNKIETVIAMLASASIGAIWTACGPEFGVEALMERFSQIEPVILFAVKEHDFHGKYFNHERTLEQLEKNLPSIKKIIFLEDILNIELSENFSFSAFPFDHPLYILYSSGTTGKPKCMVHGAGNLLLQHKKELMLHTDLHPEDKIFFYTTCSWMMWHWMISSLSVGATIVLYDGSPFYSKNSALIDLIDEYDISIFGCGAKIIETYMKNNLNPKKTHRLNSLKTILTTGSPLLKESFDYIYSNFKKIRVSSISGGSDIVSCFALGNPLLPVYSEEIQCRGLGMKVEIFDENGHSIKNLPGELVCTNAFLAMPLYFWNDPLGEKYFQAYFDKFKNVWTHGDYAKITEHNGVIIYGRSDATLNPGGIRIGTADIYEQVLKFEIISDCLAVGQQWENDERIILFVTLKNGLKLDEKLKEEIKKMIRDNTTPFHVPKKIIQVNDIPKTMNGKTMEIAVKNVINGKEIKNKEVLANPKSLEQFKNLEELRM